MTVKLLWGSWTRVDYGKTDLGKFLYWSPFLELAASAAPKKEVSRNLAMRVLEWFKEQLIWRECAVVDPHITTEDAQFVLGRFYPKDDLYVVAPSTSARRVSDGPFAVKLGPEPETIFVVGTAHIQLVEITRIRRGTPLDAYPDIVI